MGCAVPRPKVDPNPERPREGDLPPPEPGHEGGSVSPSLTPKGGSSGTRRTGGGALCAGPRETTSCGPRASGCWPSACHETRGPLTLCRALREACPAFLPTPALCSRSPVGPPPGSPLVRPVGPRARPRRSAPCASPCGSLGRLRRPAAAPARSLPTPAGPLTPTTGQLQGTAVAPKHPAEHTADGSVRGDSRVQVCVV